VIISGKILSRLPNVPGSGQEVKLYRRGGYILQCELARFPVRVARRDFVLVARDRIYFQGEEGVDLEVWGGKRNC